MKLFEIDSPESISEFLSFLYFKTGYWFDPANDVALLHNYHGNLIFPRTEGVYYESVMNQVFIFCVFYKLNIYKMAEHVFAEHQVRLAA